MQTWNIVPSKTAWDYMYYNVRLHALGECGYIMYTGRTWYVTFNTPQAPKPVDRRH